MAKCKSCGEEIGDDVMFCPKCGTKQEQEKKETSEQPLIRCKGCGEKIASDLIFCPLCGVRQNSTLNRKENVDKMIANAASVTDDLSSTVSDAYSIVKFGKKYSKTKRNEESERIEFIKEFTFSDNPSEILEQLPQLLEVQKQLTPISQGYKKMAQRKMTDAIYVLKQNNLKKEARYWRKQIETPVQKFLRVIKCLVIIAIILVVLYFTVMTIISM